MTQTLILGTRIRAPFSKPMQGAMLLFLAFLSLPPLLHFCGDDGNIEAPKPDAGAQPIDAGNDAGLDAGNEDASAQMFGRVFFVEPMNGTNVRPPLHLVFGANDFTIEKAEGGTSTDRGHFHLIVGQDCLTPGTKMIADSEHKDFSNGETEVWLEANVGTVDLCLQAASGDHVTLEDFHKIRVEVVR
jgi:hypothetical protein